MSEIFLPVSESVREKARAKLPPSFSLDLSTPERIELWGNLLTSASYTNIMLKGIALVLQNSLSPTAYTIYSLLVFLSYGKEEIAFKIKDLQLITNFSKRTLIRTISELLEQKIIELSENSTSHIKKTYKLSIDIRKDHDIKLNEFIANVVIAHPELLQYFSDPLVHKKQDKAFITQINDTIFELTEKNEQELLQKAPTLDELFYAENFPEYDE